ncbi:WXG100 family type VII secretion target [Paenibacillus lautus]|uniref:WXG100 family type VII secretion target n=1 Tax=Paenibacillus lautus TaxID=1401 RepID=UPI003D2AF96A
MPRILVPPEVLIRVSEEAARAAEELETTKNRLDQQITYMMSSWEGTTRSRFFEDFQHAHGEMNKTIEHLRIIGQELKTIAFRFISADMHEDLMLAAAAASPANEPKTFWDHAGDFWQGLQTGAKTVANSVKDTATSLVEDPLDTAKDMAYNMTIGAVEEVVDTAVWGGKMIFDADTQEKFAADVEASGGAFNFAGQQAAMTIAGLVGRRFGVKTHPHLKHDSGGGGGKVEVGKPVIEKTKWLESLQSTENFKQGTKENGLNHIFDGEILKNGNANGFHYEGMPNSKANIVGNIDPPNEFGVYQANVEISGVLKGPKSTFFPKEWTPQQVVDAVNEAFNNKVNIKNNKYIGKTSSGMEIEIILRNDKIISAFPVY